MEIFYSDDIQGSILTLPAEEAAHCVRVLRHRPGDLITARGYGPAFNHRLGHFIGLGEHEYGDVSAAFDWPVEPGMIFSIEPGIYLPGDTGVRIEDLVLVTEDGCELLNQSSHELDVIE